MFSTAEHLKRLEEHRAAIAADPDGAWRSTVAARYAQSLEASANLYKAQSATYERLVGEHPKLLPQMSALKLKEHALREEARLFQNGHRPITDPAAVELKLRIAGHFHRAVP